MQFCGEGEPEVAAEAAAAGGDPYEAAIASLGG
jgi:hypothetical protein